MEVKERIEKLREELEQHNIDYYIKAMPTISDSAYDFLMKELEALEKQHPEYYSPDSPSQKVGGAINKSFENFRHERPMLSLGNTYNEGELRAFDERVQKGLGTTEYEYICELKFDGLSISLHYEKGELIRAVTRGDGVSGDVVTDNVRTIRSLKTELKGNYPDVLEVRGEIFMHKKAFEKLNQAREEEGEKTYANPRNFASGTLKMQDSAEVAKRPLDIFLYEILSAEETDSHWKSLERAKEWGLKISSDAQKCNDIKEVLDFIHYWDEERKNLGYEIDGVVIKVNQYHQREELGFTAKSPRWAISYKFKTEAACTQLRSIDYQVGRTGSITPVANLEPVLLLGTMVKRASLHNADEIERLGLRENDFVFVEKGGEIIPKITAINLELREGNSSPIQFITHCPECHTQLVRKEGEANHYCPNATSCPPQVIGGIQHYISRKACDINSIGAETIKSLYEAKLIQNVADLYSLTFKKVLGLERMAEKSAQNVIEGINKSKETPFHRVLFGLGIRHVGATVAKKLAQQFKNIDQLASAPFEVLEAVDEIGGVIANSVIEYFSKEENWEIIQRLKSAGVQLEQLDNGTQALSDSLKGKTIVISGVFSQHSRDELAHMIEAHGGKKGSGITGKTDYLVAGDKMGPSKLAKAEKLGVPIISEQEFLDLIS